MDIKSSDYQQQQMLFEKGRKKIQALLNYGFDIVNINGVQYTAQRIMSELEKEEKYILKTQPNSCFCLKVSNMMMKLLKPYIKDLFSITQKATKTNYILFNYDEELLEALEPLRNGNNELQLVDTLELRFDKFTMPTYTNKAKLYSVTLAPVLTKKIQCKIAEIYNNTIDNEDNYFLLSNNVSYEYNAPMTIIRLLGENVISLNALNALELILVFATNSNAIYRQTNDEIKPLAISLDFFNLEDFQLNQTYDKICSSLNELKGIGLISSYSLNDENILLIHSHIIIKSIKQYSYKQHLGYYKRMGIKQQSYIYTFINYLQYIKNIKHVKITTDHAGIDKVEIPITVNKLTTTFEGLIHNLELNDYLHDFNRLATVLEDIQLIGIERQLLLPPNQYMPITKETVKYLLTHRDSLHEVLVLNPNPIQNIEKDDIKFETAFYNSGRNIIRR